MPHIIRRDFVIALGLGWLLCPVSQAQDNLKANLKETLEKGLKCRRSVEFQFVNQVVALVDAGQLHSDLVLGTFAWARKQRDDIPFPYFQAALRERAKKLGVSL